jgi:hypothetical protein
VGATPHANFASIGGGTACGKLSGEPVRPGGRFRRIGRRERPDTGSRPAQHDVNSLSESLLMVQTPFSLAAFDGRGRLCAAAMLVALIASPPARALEVLPGAYSPDVDYGRGSLAVGSDGNVYRALGAVKAKDPVAAKESDWQLAHAAFDTTLDVPGRFATIQQAMAFIGNATIADTVTVTVQLAPGNYEFREPLAVGHRDGRRLLLKGAKDPEKVVLDFNRGGGLVIDDGRSIRIDEMTLEGARNDQIAVRVDNGSTLIAANIAINGFGTGLLADHGSELVADRVAVTSEDGSFGIRLVSLSRGRLTNCRAVRTKRDAVSGESQGFLVDHGATAEGAACVASGWARGFASASSGSMRLWDSKATENAWGATVFLTAVFSATDSTFENNTERGIAVYGGSAALNDCRIRENTKYGVTSACNGLVHFGGKSCVISGHEYGIHAYAGRFHGVKPTFKDNSIENMGVELMADKNSDAVFMLR